MINMRDRRILAKGTVSMVPKGIITKSDISRRRPMIYHNTRRAILIKLQNLSLSITASKDEKL